jgi:hypothetical protein
VLLDAEVLPGHARSRKGSNFEAKAGQTVKRAAAASESELQARHEHFIATIARVKASMEADRDFHSPIPKDPAEFAAYVGQTEDTAPFATLFFGMFSANECARIIELGVNSGRFEDGLVGSRGGRAVISRRSKVIRFPLSSTPDTPQFADWDFIGKRVIQLVVAANMSLHRYELGPIEQLQLTEYDADQVRFAIACNNVSLSHRIRAHVLYAHSHTRTRTHTHTNIGRHVLVAYRFPYRRWPGLPQALDLCPVVPSRRLR